MSKSDRLEISEVVGTIVDGMSGVELLLLVNTANDLPYLKARVQLIHAYDEYDTPEMEIVGVRPETDAEYEKRKAEEKAKREKKKALMKRLNDQRVAKDRALYEKLKKQFDPS